MNLQAQRTPPPLPLGGRFAPRVRPNGPSLLTLTPTLTLTLRAERGRGWGRAGRPRLAAVAALALLIACGAGPRSSVGPTEALGRLTEGNRRYVHRRAVHPHQNPIRRAAISRGQQPFAIVLGCADSRVPPEVVFDQGLGDLFVIRVAGNIVDDAVLGSIEYAVEQLGVHLIFVLGHERCGAVDAALKGAHPHGHIGRLVEAIQPAIGGTSDRPGDPLDHAVRANVAYVVGQLKADEPVLSHRVKAGAVQVVGGRYDLDTGVVELVR